MFGIIISYIQFLYMQVYENALPFFLVFLGVPAFWLLLKLTGIIKRERSALKIGAIVFSLTSLVAIVLLFLHPDVQEYYKPLLWLSAGLLTFLVVSPIFCENPSLSFSRKRKQFVIDDVTYYYDALLQVAFKRCFTRTKPSCLVEFYYKDETHKHHSVYYETNDVQLIRSIIPSLRRETEIYYDCAFTKCTLEVEHFSLVIKTVLTSILLFCLVIPAHFDLKQKVREKHLPAYRIVTIPQSLYEPRNIMKLSDPVETLFRDPNIQVSIFYGPYSSHFVGNYRKALYSASSQDYTYNMLYLSEHGLSLRRPREARVHLTVTPDFEYTKFLTSNCGKLCFIDNQLKVLYTTDIDTIDPRSANVQDSINMYEFVVSKRLEQKNLRSAATKAN